MEKSLHNKKAQLREHYRKIRNSINDANRRQWDAAIARRILALPGVISADVVFSYLSMSAEVATLPIVDALLVQGKHVLTPSANIHALPHEGMFKVSPRLDPVAAFIPEQCIEGRIEAIDVIIVPGIVWDEAGYRIGFGGGYFDRLLSMARPDCLKIGLAYECQVTEDVPREHWDEQVAMVITECKTYGKRVSQI